ncbi:hypothetical protein [Desulfoscipio sp. XC116]|uniref:hypothetical protein n=1 Tax=Desulfoscipio sp. XC116 TaxID=3144975 RepID=UPI00325B426B
MPIRKIMLSAVFIMCITLSLIGCSATEQADSGANKSNQGQQGRTAGEGGISGEEQKAVISDFNALVKDNGDIQAIIKYVDSNIAKLSPENASQMVVGLEKAQVNYLPQITDELYSDNNTIAQKFMDEYKPGVDINDAGAIKDKELKELVTRTKNAGYKVDTAEGMFYPIIDYQCYQDYSSRVTPDIKAYIDIMAAESDNPPAKDAALVIGWDTVLTRALNQEKFINTYLDSVKLADVQMLYERYVQFALLGANNTPLFSYEDKMLSPEARLSYAKVLAESEPSQLTAIIQEMLDTAEQNNDRLTAGVENYRKKCFEELGID